MLAIRRMSKTWRDQMRVDAGEIRAEKTKVFFAKSLSPENADVLAHGRERQTEAPKPL
jgi:uncharacterized membrane protein